MRKGLIRVKRIFKYEIDLVERQVIEIPSKTILSVKEQNGAIVSYAIADSDIEPTKYEFLISGTGHSITFEVEDYKFLDTVKMNNGSLMFHIFYRRCKELTR